jgi:uncharacterized protein YdhG (YjbR/CyaY superfamily)
VPKRPRTIDEYLDGVHGPSRAALQKVRRAVRAAANHCWYRPMSGTTVATLRTELAGYDTSAGTIRFSPREPLPAKLVRKRVKARIAELAD